MRKILIAFDGSEFSESAFQFASALNEIQPILLTGVFIPQASYAALWSFSNAMTGPVYAPLVEEDEMESTKKNIEQFESLCIKNNISFRVHRDFNDFALPALKVETRFADLMIINSEHFFTSLVSNYPMEYLKEIIHESECPVIVIPDKYTFPTRNVIAYDAHASSVYAMKQFAYLFPELALNETLLVYSGHDKDPKLPREDYLEELATRYYKNLTLTKLEMDPKKYFTTWLMENGSPMVICGSYGRSYLSQLFKKSFATDVIEDLKLPVFIAHL